MEQLVVFNVEDLRAWCCGANRIDDQLAKAEVGIEFPDALKDFKNFADSMRVAHVLW